MSETFLEEPQVQVSHSPESCAFRPSCPTGFCPSVFISFIRFLASRAPPGGVSGEGFLGRLILDDFGVILEAILGAFWGSFLVQI